MNYSSWYQKTFPDLSGHGLWLRGGELNTVPAPEFERRAFRVLITRLSTWRDTADSFTHKLLHQIISRIDGTYPDLAYLPPPGDTALFDRDNVPWLLGTTTKHEGRDFSVIALSLSIVQELLNIPVMLQKSGIPLSKRERLRDPACPLIILGGASALYTSALFNNDPPVDGIFAGEDARMIGKVFKVCKEGYFQKLSKGAILEKLRKIPGFFMPEGKPATTVYQAAELPPEQLLEAGPVLYDKECIGTANLQISEGCKCLCGFCAESFGRKPYREYGAPQILDAALRCKASMGVHDMELYSFNFSMHRDFYRILWDLSAVFPSIGLKSQRFDSISADPEIVTFLHAIGKTSITCGIEGISPRLRRYLHKELEEEDMNKSLTVLFSSPIRELKIFLIATGLEQQDDYDEFRELLAFINKTMHTAERTPRVIFSMTILVRFPWTPLEFEDAPDPMVCQTVLRVTERLVRAAGFEFRASSDSCDYWLSQLLVRANDPGIGQALRKAQHETGFIYYREIPRSFIDTVRKYLEHEGIKPDRLLKGFLPTDRPSKLWSNLCPGVSEEFLTRQWESTTQYRANGCCTCGKNSSKQCISVYPAPRNYSLTQFRARLRSAQADAVPLYFRMHIEPVMAGIPHVMRGTMLACALMMTDKRLVEGYRGFRQSSTFDGPGSDWVIGDDLVTLVWNEKSAEIINHHILHDAVFREKIHAILAGRENVIGISALDHIEIKTILFRSPFQFDPSEFCKHRSLKFTLRKNGPDIMRYELSKESLRKKIFGTCVVERHPGDHCTVSLTPGPKFMPEEFARTAFRLPAENEWVRIAMAAKA
jgi:radical SAM superfamily enzyme YgiQ (UPF0313 family)